MSGISDARPVGFQGAGALDGAREFPLAKPNASLNHVEADVVKSIPGKSVMLIREMKPEDAAGVAEIQTLAWRKAYRGIVDQGYLDSIDVQKREVNWREGTARNEPRLVRLVAELESRVVGFACGLENRQVELLPRSDSELWAIYVHPDAFGRGVGRALLERFAAEMKALGKKRMCVWVFSENLGAHRFYEKTGGTRSGRTKQVKIGKQYLTEAAFEYEFSGPMTKQEAAPLAAVEPPVLFEGARVIQRPGWFQIVTPGLKDASANEVLLSKVDEPEVDARVEETLALYQANGLPFKWSIGPMSAPARLEAAIAPHAATSWSFRGMSIDTDVTLPKGRDISVERVTSENFEAFLEVNLTGWEVGNYREQTNDKLRKMAEHPAYRCFLARKGEEAVGAASTLVKGGGFGYLVGAVVLSKYRGVGAYRALIGARLADLNGMGLKFAVTQARESTSAPILEKLGFATEYRAKIYKFDK